MGCCCTKLAIYKKKPHNNIRLPRDLIETLQHNKEQQNENLVSYLFCLLACLLACLSFIDGQTAGQIRPKIGRGTPGDLGSNIGGSIFLWG